jgi:integrase
MDTKPVRKARRRTRCMFKDSRGRWWLDYYAPNGKRRRKLIGKSKTDAERELRKIKTTIDSNSYVDPAKAPSFSDFSAIFMERHGQHKTSYARNDGMFQRLKDFFGHVRISKINSGHIESYRLMRLAQKSRADRTVSNVTVNRDVEVLRSMLGKAVRWGFIGRNPASEVEDYDEDNRRERFLSSDEIRSLLRATKQSESPILRPAVYLALQTGMRKSELLGLRWSDVNFEARQILARYTNNGEPRQVPMSRRSTWLLKKMAAKNPLAEWVFESHRRDLTKAPASQIKTAWRRALRLARIEGFRFHDLRHTFASHFAMRHGDLYALAKILGHRNPKITLDRYAHLSPEFVHAQKDIMDGMYTGGRTDGHLMDTVRKNRKDSDSQVIEKSGAPGEIRTPDPLVRRQAHYSAQDLTTQRLF